MRIKATRGADNYTKGEIYNIVDKDDTFLYIIDDAKNKRAVYNWAIGGLKNVKCVKCADQYAIVMQERLNNNIKVL